MHQSNLKWDIRFLQLARFVSSWSKDPSTQVGACIANGKLLVSLGFNGLPMGVSDTTERLMNRELKYPMTIHAEENAILFAKRDLTNHTLYVWPLPPCAPCATKIIQNKISKVVTVAEVEPDKLARWNESFNMSSILFDEAGIEVSFIDRTLLS